VGVLVASVPAGVIAWGAGPKWGAEVMRRVVRASLVVTIVAAACTLAGPSVGASSAGVTRARPRRVDGTAAIMNALGRPAKPLAGLPSWSSSFVFGGTTYPYTMLGTDPHAGSATTKLRVKIIPVRMTFDDGGITLDGHDIVKDVLRSPIFQKAGYRSGRTQYADAMQRAEFWNTVQSTSPKYHVLLAAPKVLPTVPIEVPAGSGHAFQTPNGPTGVVTTAFLLSLLPLVTQYYDPKSVLVFLVKDVSGDTFLGFHFAFTPSGQTLPQTLIFSGVFTPNVVTGPSDSDVYVLSHEFAEWINDPYLNNNVPQWVNPGDGTCFSTLLEVGDPVEFLANNSFEVTTHRRTYHVTDVAGLSWFAHESPPTELGGAYSYNGALTAPSDLC